MKETGRYTKRVHDTPTWLVMLFIGITVVAIYLAIFGDEVTIFPNEMIGIEWLAVVCIGLSAYITHVWKWGRKETYRRSSTRTHRAF